MIRIFTSSYRKFVKFFTEKCEELISTALQWGVKCPTSILCPPAAGIRKSKPVRDKGRRLR